MDHVFHIAVREDWERSVAAGSYRVSTLSKALDDVGFVHLSFAHQVKTVADATYRGRSDLLLLELDPDRLGSPIRVEALTGSPERFPHLYGEINLDAVIAAHPLDPGPDGRFDPIS